MMAAALPSRDHGDCNLAAIGEDETEIRGNWRMVRRRMKANKACKRIHSLVDSHLRKIAED